MNINNRVFKIFGQTCVETSPRYISLSWLKFISRLPEKTCCLKRVSLSHSRLSECQETSGSEYTDWIAARLKVRNTDESQQQYYSDLRGFIKGLFTTHHHRVESRYPFRTLRSPENHIIFSHIVGRRWHTLNAELKKATLKYDPWLN